MRTRFDQLAKQMLRNLLLPVGVVELEAEVPPGEVQRIDVWFVPDPARAEARARLGLLGRIAAEPSLIEPFHHAVTFGEVVDCVRKHLNWAHATGNDASLLWVVSAGRPRELLLKLQCRQLGGWPPGVYDAPLVLRTRLVVVPELPPGRDTLPLRLLGAGEVFRKALGELLALPQDAEEHRHVVPLLLRLRFEIVEEPGRTMHEDEEYIARSEELFQAYTRQVKLEGLKEGREEGRKEELRRLFARRLGRELTAAESALFARRFASLGATPIEDLILDGARDALAAWLAAGDLT